MAPLSRQAELEFTERIEQVVQAKASSSKDRTVYSVTELVQLAARSLETAFSRVWVEGEVSNLKAPSSGHLYFTLKDDVAALAVVMFRSDVARLKFQIESGQKLRCVGRLTIYDAQGRFQLTANNAEPAGLGALQLAFEQLQKKLRGEGLFDEIHKKPLPFFPKTIAIVTSPTGAAVHDVLRIVRSRCPVRVIVCPTSVQGPDAPGEIMQAIRMADTLAVDLMIVGRGGGSLEDLWAFNTEEVARAIFAARTPIISAVGHEIDVTIADFVADRRAPTPTAAAEMAVPLFVELQEQLAVCRSRLAQSISRHLKTNSLTLERLQRAMGTPTSLLDRRQMRLDELQARLELLMQRTLNAQRERLSRTRHQLELRHPTKRLERYRSSLAHTQSRLAQLMQLRLATLRTRFASSLGRLETLSPLAVLARGYSLAVGREGSLIRDATQVVVGEEITIRPERGELVCRVTAIRSNKP